MLYRTDDPLADYSRYCAEQQEWLDSLPLCECCGEPIQQEKAIHYNDQWCCEDCEDTFWQGIREDFLERVETDG